MRAVIQRVSQSSVSTGNKITGQIGAGLLVLVGIEESDTTEDVEWLAGKIARMRIFPDSDGVMNRSVLECGGDILVVSQFTLHASTKKGNRPSYIQAAKPQTAIPLYHSFIRQLEMEMNKPVQTGEFGAMMQVMLVNDGPVTILVDTKNKV
jgi:D-aminoacyl-tRNA deacylase